MTQWQPLFMTTVGATTALAHGGEHHSIYSTPDCRTLRAVLASSIRHGIWLVTDRIGGVMAEALIGFEPRVPVFETAGYWRMVGYSPDPASIARLVGYDASAQAPIEPVRRLALCQATLSWACRDTTYPPAEYSVAAASTRANVAGLRLDTEQARQFAETMAFARVTILGNAKREWGLDAQTLANDTKLRGWLRSNVGVTLKGLSRKRVERHEVARESPTAASVLQFRDQLRAVTAVHRDAAAAAKVPGGRIYGFLEYGGAHTGRFTSRPACGVDLHGLRRDSKRLGVAGLGRLRSVILPEEGRNFVAADLSTVEPRVLAWLADEREMLTWLRENRDIYSAFAQLVCPGLPISKEANPELRELGKSCVLGLGYLIGLAAFEDSVICELGHVDRDLIRRAYATYTTRFPRIRQLGGDLLTAFRLALSGSSTPVGKIWFHHQAEPFGTRGVRVDLPTGRSLHYRAIQWFGGEEWYARLHWLGDGPDPRPGKENERLIDHQWRSPVRASVLVENVTQAIARDLLAHMTLELERHHLPVAFTRHDEIIVQAGACRCTSFDGRHDDDACQWLKATRTLEQVMSRVPASLPNLADMPVAANVNHAVRTSYA